MFEELFFVILLTVWFFLPVFEFMKLLLSPTDNEMPIDNPDEALDESPSIFIDKTLLPTKKKFECYQQEFQYIFDGVPFQERFYTDRFKKFEVYNYIKMDNSEPSSNHEGYLQLYRQTAPNGFIINGNVYITLTHWNTLVPISETSYNCTVCNVCCDEAGHFQLESHINNMEKYKPLEKYDLSITRKIDSYLHCGVCNIVFQEMDVDDHFASKEHEGKMLFAINKVSDLMFDITIHSDNNNIELKKDTYYYDVRAMNHLDDLSSEESDDDDDDDYYDDDDNCGEDDEDDEHFYDNVEPPLNLEHSYASMARKPKTQKLPEVLEIDLGTKRVTVKFDSWHMMVTPQPHRFYCMVCTKFDHMRRKAEHTRSEEHVSRLDQCRVVEMYEKYLVRQVDAKLYHCGHCNNLQLINEMEPHIEAQHVPKNTNLDSPAKSRPSTPLKKPANGSVARNILEVKNQNIGQNGNQANTVNSQANNANSQANNVNSQANNVNSQANNVNSQANNVNSQAYNVNSQANNVNSQANNINSQANNINGQVNRNGQMNINQANQINQVAQFSQKNNQVIHVNGQANNINAQAKYPNTGNLNMYHDLRVLNNNLDDDIIICTYGYKLRLSKIAFNLVCQRDFQFYCGICEMIINKDDLKAHVNELQHIILLQRTPFIAAFNIHFYRQIREALHCSLCNELIPLIPDVIFRHRAEPKHLLSLGRALRSSNQIHPAVAKTVERQAEILKSPSNNLMQSIESVIYKVKPTVKAKPVAPKIEEIAPVKNPVDVKTAPKKQEETEEFIEVKNGAKECDEESADELNDSMDTPFDFEEYLYVKFGNSYIKITNTSYNTLVEIGDGTRYCFVCSLVVTGDLKKHVDSRAHMENVDKNKFVDKYKEDLLRQIYLMYHCSICNVLITRKQLNHHLAWPTHVLQTENTKIASKQRKNEIKAGMKQITAATQKENIYLNDSEATIKIIMNVTIQKENTVSVERKNKIIIFNDNVLKISFDAWHSVTALANGWKCKVCQTEFGGKEFANHVSSDWHKGYLDKFDKQYSPALIRKINDSTLNCIMCNTEVSTKHHIVLEHIQGKKHLKNYDTILKESSVANSYADCDEDVLTL